MSLNFALRISRQAFVALLTLTPVVGHAQRLVATPDSKTGIYQLKSKVGWTVALAPGEQAANGPYTYIIQENGAQQIGQGSFDLSKGPARIETSLSEPGMVRVAIRPPAGTKGFGNVHTGGDGVVVLGAAVDPTGIKPVDQRPADFDAFWSAKIAELAKVPVNAMITTKPGPDTSVNYATFRLNNIGGAHVYGQMAWPKREGKFPAMVIYQWASPPYPLQPAWVTDRAKQGWLAVNVEPHDVPSDMPQAFYDALPQMIKEYARVYTNDRDKNYFLQMYLGDYRAVEWMATLPQWDGKILVANGTSMGGQQSLAMAGLNKRITGVVVNVPAGSDANASLYHRMPGYPNWDSKNPQVAQTARYFDVTNLASHITVPTMAAMGFIDEVCPAIGVWTTFNLINAPKEAVPMIDSPHNHQATPEQLEPWNRRSEIWLEALRKGEAPPIPTATSSR